MTRNHRNTRLVAVATLALLLGACSIDSINRPAAGSGALTGTLISASVQVPVAAPGEEVPVRFINASTNLVSVNTCLRRVERRDGTAWIPLPDELRLCAPSLSLVAALSEASYTTDVPLDLVAGNFRFVFSVASPTGPAVDVTTPAFRVE